MFRTSAFPEEYQSQDWRDALKSALTYKLQTSYISAYPGSYVEVETEGFTTGNTSIPEPVALAKRSNDQEFFFVDINLLPESLQPRDIEVIRNVCPRACLVHLHVKCLLPPVCR